MLTNLRLFLFQRVYLLSHGQYNPSPIDIRHGPASGPASALPRRIGKTALPRNCTRKDRARLFPLLKWIEEAHPRFAALVFRLVDFLSS